MPGRLHNGTGGDTDRATVRRFSASHLCSVPDDEHLVGGALVAGDVLCRHDDVVDAVREVPGLEAVGASRYRYVPGSRHARWTPNVEKFWRVPRA